MCIQGNQFNVEVSRSDKLSLPGFENLTAGYNKFLRPNFGGRLSFVTRTAVQKDGPRKKMQRRASGGSADSTLIGSWFRKWEGWMRTFACGFLYYLYKTDSASPAPHTHTGKVEVWSPPFRWLQELLATRDILFLLPYFHIHGPRNSPWATSITHQPSCLNTATYDGLPSFPPGSPPGSSACSESKHLPQPAA